MKHYNPATRSMLLFAIFAVLMTHAVASWAFIRFVHADAQNRILAAQHYDVQVLTGEEYRRLSDPAIRETTLTEGTTIIKASMWDEVVLPSYKPTSNEEHYVLVTTRGTAHVLSYLEPYLLLFTVLAICGLIVSIWNLKMMQRESMTKTSPPDGELLNVDASDHTAGLGTP